MATVPNYYYNSPWMADIGRNLASALAPPDPTVLQQREINQFNLDNARTNAAAQADQRRRSLVSRGALKEMYELQRNPVLDAAGKPDRAATEKRAFELAGIAIENGDKGDRAEVDDALFNLSPQFARKKILQAAGAQYASDRLTRSLAGALEQITARGQVQQGLQDDQQAFELEKMDKLYGHRLKEWQLRIDGAAKAKGVTPTKITPALRDGIYKEILIREAKTGNKLTPEARFQLGAEIAAQTVGTGDYVSAAQEQWNNKFPGFALKDAPTQEVSEPDSLFNSLLRGVFGYDPTDTYLAPKGTPAPAAAPTAAPEDNSLGAAATTPPPAALTPNDRIRMEGEMTRESNARAAAETAAMPTPKEKPAAKKAAAPAPSSPKPPRVPRGSADAGTPPVDAKWKEGDVRRYKSNGQAWQLVNGKPVRRRDLEAQQ